MRRLLVAWMAVAVLASPAVAEPRLLLLGGAVTETVFALGEGSEVVGTDLTSQFPPSVAALPKVGYLRALGAEGMLSLNPAIVLASADAGPPAALSQVAAAGVRIVSLPEAHTPEAALERVRRVGAALGREAAAGEMIAAMSDDLAIVAGDVAGSQARPRVLFLLSVGRGAPMAAGTGTAADAMIRLAGGVNAVTGLSGYHPLSAEAALLAAPDVILTTSEVLRGAGGAAGLVSAPGLSATPAGRDGRVVSFDTLYLLGFGPRLAQAIHELAAALHPQERFRTLPARPWARPG